MTVPKACQPLATELEAAYVVLEKIQSSPGYIDKEGPHAGKPNPGALRDAQQQQAKIRQLTSELNACKLKHGVPPEELVKFSGHASLHAPQGSGGHDFSITLEFLDGHKRFFVQEFPPIPVTVKKVDPKTGQVEDEHTVTVTQSGGGNGHFESKTGHLDLQIDLLVDAPSPGGHMDVDIKLATDGDGTPLNTAGELTIVGKTVAHGSGIGFPATAEVTLSAKGKVSPKP